MYIMQTSSFKYTKLGVGIHLQDKWHPARDINRRMEKSTLNTECPLKYKTVGNSTNNWKFYNKFCVCVLYAYILFRYLRNIIGKKSLVTYSTTIRRHNISFTYPYYQFWLWHIIGYFSIWITFFIQWLNKKNILFLFFNLLLNDVAMVW